MPANLKLKNSTGSAYASSITFSGVVPGTRSAAQTFRLYNDDASGTVDPATDPYLIGRVRDAVTDEPLLRGIRAVDERWIEIEATGVAGGGGSQMATGISPIGRSRVLRLSDIPSGGWVELKLYYHPPQSAPEGSIRFTLDAEVGGPSFAVDQGHTESSRDGILNGIGDGEASEIIIGGTMTATGTPDADVHFPDLAWEWKGIPYVLLAHAETTNGNDFSSVALASGEAYWARVSLGTALHLTKSNKFSTGSANPDDVPAVPAGELDGGYFLRDYSAAIGTSDITSRLYAGRFEPSVNALNMTRGGGRARVDNALIERRSRPVISLPASQATVYVWLTPDGQLAYSIDGSRPDPRAYLLGVGPTGSSSITLADWSDLRDPIGAERIVVPFTWSGTLTDGLQATAVYPGARTGYIRVPRGLAFLIHTNGSGNTTGVTKADVKINATTVFTSSGSVDRRPSIAFNAATPLATAGLPEVLAIPPFAKLDAFIRRTTSYDGTAPSGASLALIVEMP